MTEHYSYLQLFHAIRDNDVDSLEEAIFYLGARVHAMCVWRNLTPVEYAARLGHFGQAKILLEDSWKYDWSHCLITESVSLFQPGSERVRNVFDQAIRHSETADGQDFLMFVIEKFFETARYTDDPPSQMPEFLNSRLLESIVDHGAADMMHTVLKKKTEKISMAVEHCFKTENSRILRSLGDRYKDHPLMVKALDKFRESSDAMYFAIMTGDNDIFRSLLPQFLEDPRILKSAEGPVKACLRFLFQVTDHALIIGREWIKYLYWSSPKNMKRILALLEVVITTDDVHMFKILIETSNVLFSALTTCKMFVDWMLLTALDHESLNILEALTADERLDTTEINWNSEYLSLLIRGKLKSAAEIEKFRTADEWALPWTRVQLRALLSDAGAKFDSRLDLRNGLKRAASKLSAELMDQLVDGLRMLLGPTGVLWEGMQETLRELPMVHRRPDLVEPFTKYGISYTECDVVESILQDSSYSEYEQLKNRVTFDGLVGDTYDRLRYIYLEESDSRFITTIDDFPFPGELVQAMRECVLRTGRTKPFDEVSNFAASIFGEKLEDEVRRPRNLQHLCRQTVRGAVRRANPGRSLDVAIHYLRGRVPKLLILYLLYRESDTSLYYALNYFVQPIYVEEEPDSDAYENYYEDSSVESRDSSSDLSSYDALDYLDNYLDPDDAYY